MGCKTSVDSIYNLISLQKSSSIYLVSSFTGWITHCLGSVPWSALRNFTNTNQGKVFYAHVVFRLMTIPIVCLCWQGGSMIYVCSIGTEVSWYFQYQRGGTKTQGMIYKRETVTIFKWTSKNYSNDLISLCTRGCKVAMNSILQILLNRMRRHKKLKGASKEKWSAWMIKTVYC